VVVASVPATGASGLYIAQQRGLFAAAGLKVTILSSVSASNVVADLLKGSVNVSLGQWTSAIAVQAQGIKLRAIAAGNSGGPALEELVASSHSGITKPSQLRGKTIAVNALAGLSQILVESVLASDGITAAQLHFTVIPFPDMGTALAAHRVDAAFMIQPYLSQLEAARQVTELADLDQGATANFPITGYVVSAAWAQKYPATVAAFTRALNAGQKLAATNRAAVDQAVVAFTPVPAKAVAKMAVGTFPLTVDPTQLQRVGALMQTYGLLPKSVSIPALIAAMTK
jgi:NitT/TauT family transport system substrate-binding protein